ncbi:hypothetical protein [Acidovorax sp. SUPP3334]|uniref:hypothetical protein n=1 Tax=Acidovorax sp. SUPP3334 TaxID=2920881 RepID=UPI0023DE5B14|nr:hypothetical protein [Acidovorax sp. SUPP3334]GKT23092.1 hypothetical protein AVHM3334_10535 [Acidovorax sp. SUPP3334]
MFLFLIVLMALRGLAGNAMAAGIVMPAGAAMHTARAPAQPLAVAAIDRQADALPGPSYPAPGTEHGAPVADTPGAFAGHALHTAPAEPSAPSWQPPCHGTDTAAPAHGSDQDTTTHTGAPGHEGGCSACGICHSAMLTPPLGDLSRPALPRAPLPMAERRFASALAAQAIKPPIS